MPYFIASPSGEMHPFVFEMGASLDWPEVVILAQLGGWVPHKKRPPGKQVMLRSLAQLLNYYATQAVLRRDPETSRRLLEKFPSTGSGQASAQAWNFEFLLDSSPAKAGGAIVCYGSLVAASSPYNLITPVL